MKKLVAFALAFMPLAAGAQVTDPWGVGNAFGSTNVALGTRPLRETIAGIVNIILGFLGILATLIVLLGGFKWMTSQGNTEKVDEAKKLIGAGIVGLVIILVAYAVSRFILQAVANQTLNYVGP
ncbi:pilin [bacterium]|nr:pilin [bacterium]